MKESYPILKTESVSKIYGTGHSQVTALNDVSLQLHSGEILLIMGPSGSGKTTLLSIMGCILRASAGQVWVDGKDVSGMDEQTLPSIRRRYFGFVFQAFNLFASLTALENVQVVLRMKGVPKQRISNEAAALLDAVGLSRRAHAYPKDLSGGEKQRTALARALAGDPRIVLADEPTANLDSKTGQDVLTLLRDLAEREQKAVAVVSHDPKAQQTADRVLVLQDGKLQ